MRRKQFSDGVVLMSERVLLTVDAGIEMLKASDFGFQRLYIVLFPIAMPPV